jgi:hypothetical protein
LCNAQVRGEPQILILKLPALALQHSPEEALQPPLLVFHRIDYEQKLTYYE